MDDLTQIPLPKDLEGQDPPELVVKVEWNFSYKLRAHHSDNYLEMKEEILQMERIKQKKKINNLIDTIE